MSAYASESLGDTLSVAVVTTAGYLGATSYRIPSGLSPFDI